MGLATVFTCGHVQRFGRREVAAEAVHLGLLVEGITHRRVVSRCQALTGSLGFVHRGLPSTRQRHDLGAVDEALSSERDEIGLCLAPPRESVGPLPCSAQVENHVTRLDDGAIDDAADDRRRLTGRHARHRVVEQREARVLVAEMQEASSHPEPAERPEVDVTEPLPGLEHDAELGVPRSPGHPSTRRPTPWGPRDSRAPRCRALRRAVSQREPTPGLRHVAAWHQRHRVPPGRERRPFGLAALLVRLHGPLPERVAFEVAPGQVGGRRGTLELAGCQGRDQIGGHVALVGVGPRHLRERCVCGA